MKNILLKIAYDGTNYSGWQKQKNAKTVEEEIENAIFKITKENVKIIGSGRTDKNVHALGQIANFITSSNIDSSKFKNAINAYLPKDIRILLSKSTDLEFNSRYDAVKKTYQYNIYNDKVMLPFYENYFLLVKEKLDLELINKNLEMLVGEHDFTSFYTMEKDVKKNPVRTIYEAKIIKSLDNEKILKFKITGNSFLYNMVRIIVGTILDIGTYKNDKTVKEILQLKNRAFAGKTAKAKGLFLKEVFY